MSNMKNIPEFEEDYEYEEESIDWGKYFELLIINWKRIFIVSCIFGAIGVAVALLQKRKYEVTITLAPEVQSPTRSGSSLSSLASMFGMNMMNMSSLASDAYNITIFPEIVNSTPFLTQLFDVELSVTPKKLPDTLAVARKIMEGPLPKVKLYDHLTGRDDPSWLSSLITDWFGPFDEDPEYMRANVSLLTYEQYKVLKKLKKNVISVDVDKKTAMATISVHLDDQIMCSQLADTICSRLRDYVFAYRTEKEQQNFNYYDALCDSTYQKMLEAQSAYAASQDNNHSVILHSVSVRRERLQQEASMASQIYQQMVQQREISRARLQELKPVFAVVEPGTFPHKPVNSRKKTVLLFGFFGFFVSAGWYVLGKNYYNKYMSMLKELLSKVQ